MLTYYSTLHGETMRNEFYTFQASLHAGCARNVNQGSYKLGAGITSLSKLENQARTWLAGVCNASSRKLPKRKHLFF